MKLSIPAVVSVLALLLLGGCGSSPAVRYYNLESMDARYGQQVMEGPVLTIGPIRLPQYLDRPQMVSRGVNSEILVDDQNRWAEPLSDSVHRIVSANVDSLLPTVTVIAYPSSALLKVHFRIVGRISQFDVDSGGKVVLIVQWGAGNVDGDPLVSPRRHRYETQASDTDNPGAIARAMSEALEQFSRDIADSVGETFP